MFNIEKEIGFGLGKFDRAARQPSGWEPDIQDRPTVKVTISGNDWAGLSAGIHILYPTVYVKTAQPTYVGAKETWKHSPVAPNSGDLLVFHGRISSLTPSLFKVYSFGVMYNNTSSNYSSAYYSNTGTSIAALTGNGWANNRLFTTLTLDGTTITVERGTDWLLNP